MKNRIEKLSPGTLIDADIRELGAHNELITENFEADCVKQACYELRMSDVFVDTTSSSDNKETVIPADGEYILRPFSFVVCITKEKINLPPNMLGRILAKGQLFSIGVVPVNTYADPGFHGRLGITLCNVSRKYILLKANQRIAKIEFVVLKGDVKNPYNGQHGYETEMWPIPVQLIGDEGKLRKEGRLGTISEELARSYGNPIADLSRKVDYYSKTVWLQLGATVAVFAALLVFCDEISLLSSIAVGVFANFLTHIGVTALDRHRIKKLT